MKNDYTVSNSTFNFDEPKPDAAQVRDNLDKHLKKLILNLDKVDKQSLMELVFPYVVVRVWIDEDGNWWQDCIRATFERKPFQQL